MAEPEPAAESAADRTLVITRMFDVPARILFQAYATPEHLRQWFGPDGYPLTLCELDFRVGGRFRFAMTGPEGIQHTPFGGEYLAIVRNRKIVYHNGFELPGAVQMVVTVTFEEEAPDRTRLTMTTVFASIAMYREHVGFGFEQGTNSGFDHLAILGRRLLAAEDA